jgi:hypothetical protein
MTVLLLVPGFLRTFNEQEESFTLNELWNVMFVLLLIFFSFISGMICKVACRLLQYGSNRIKRRSAVIYTTDLLFSSLSASHTISSIR